MDIDHGLEAQGFFKRSFQGFGPDQVGRFFLAQGLKHEAVTQHVLMVRFFQHLCDSFLEVTHFLGWRRLGILVILTGDSRQDQAEHQEDGKYFFHNRLLVLI